MLGSDLFLGGGKGAREGQSYRRFFYRFVFKPNGAAAMTPDTTQSDYEAIPDNAVVVNAMCKVKTTFAGNGIAALELGDGGDPNRWGSANAVVRNTAIMNATALTPVLASTYAPLLTGDQIATSGEAIALYVVDVPQFDFSFPA